MPEGKSNPLLPAIASAVPVIGAFGSAALQQHYAQKNWDRVNAYNHPKQQIQRLKEAGLPLATMFGGQGGSTSTPINTPNVDPTLGTAEGMSRGMQLEFQRRQMQLMDQNIRSATYDADIKEKLRDFELETTLDSSDGENRPDFEPQFGDSNLIQGVRRERALKEVQLGTDRVIQALKNIDLTNAPEKIRAEIDHVLQLIDIGELQIKRDKNYFDMLDKVSRDIIQGDTGWEGMKRFIKTWLYKFLLR